MFTQPLVNLRPLLYDDFVRQAVRGSMDSDEQEADILDSTSSCRPYVPPQLIRARPCRKLTLNQKAPAVSVRNTTIWQPTTLNLLLRQVTLITRQRLFVDFQLLFPYVFVGDSMNEFPEKPSIRIKRHQQRVR